MGRSTTNGLGSGGKNAQEVGINEKSEAYRAFTKARSTAAFAARTRGGDGSGGGVDCSTSSSSPPAATFASRCSRSSTPKDSSLSMSKSLPAARLSKPRIRETGSGTGAACATFHDQSLPDFANTLGHKLLLFSYFLAAVVRMLESTIFPDVSRQAHPDSSSGAADHCRDSCPSSGAGYCDDWRQCGGEEGQIGDAVGGEVLAIQLICAMCWVAILCPFPAHVYWHYREMCLAGLGGVGNASRGYSKRRNRRCKGAGRSPGHLARSCGSGRVDRIRSLFGTFMCWFLRPSILQPLRLASTPEEAAVLALITLLEEERRGFVRGAISGQPPLPASGSDSCNGFGKNHLRSEDTERWLQFIMNTPRIKEENNHSSFVTIADQLTWTNPSSPSELQSIAVFLIIASAVLHVLSIFCLAERGPYARSGGGGKCCVTKNGSNDSGGNGAACASLGIGLKRGGLERLVVKGPYRLTRNPMALASIGSAVGFLCATPSPAGFAALPFLMFATNAQVAREEIEMDQYYGEAYRIYLGSVPRYVGFVDVLSDLIELTAGSTSSATLMTEEDSSSWWCSASSVAHMCCLGAMILIWLVSFWDYGGLSHLPGAVRESCCWAGAGSNNGSEFVREGGDSLFASRLRIVDVVSEKGEDYSTGSVVSEILRDDCLAAPSASVSRRESTKKSNSSGVKVKKGEKMAVTRPSSDLHELKSAEKAKLQLRKDELLSRLANSQDVLVRNCIGLRGEDVDGC